MTWQELLRRLGLTDAQILRLTSLLSRDFDSPPFPQFLNPQRRPEIVPVGGRGTLSMLDRVFGRPEGLERLSPEERGTQTPTVSDVISDITGGGIGGTLGGAGSATGGPFEDVPTLPELPEENYGMGGGWTAR